MCPDLFLVCDQNLKHIDIWHTDDATEQGTTAAIVDLDTGKVIYFHNEYRAYPEIQAAIAEILASLNDKWIITVLWRSWGQYQIPKSKFPTLAEAIAHSSSLALPQQGEYMEDSLEIDWEGIVLHNNLPEEEVEQIRKVAEEETLFESKPKPDNADLVCLEKCHDIIKNLSVKYS